MTVPEWPAGPRREERRTQLECSARREELAWDIAAHSVRTIDFAVEKRQRGLSRVPRKGQVTALAIEEKGFRILRFTNDEVLSDVEAVKEAINRFVAVDVIDPSPSEHVD